MNKSILILLWLILAFGCSNNKEQSIQKEDIEAKKNEILTPSKDFEIIQSDGSLIIRDSKLLIDPFMFGNDPLKKLSNRVNVKIYKQTYLNRHFDNQTDTSFTMKFTTDSFEVFKVHNENWLIKANVYSKEFAILNYIQIGMKKKKFTSLFSEYKIDEVPDIVQIENIEVTNWINILFQSDTLFSIKFNGYVD